MKIGRALVERGHTFTMVWIEDEVTRVPDIAVEVGDPDTISPYAPRLSLLWLAKGGVAWVW